MAPNKRLKLAAPFCGGHPFVKVQARAAAYALLVRHPAMIHRLPLVLSVLIAVVGAPSVAWGQRLAGSAWSPRLALQVFQASKPSTLHRAQWAVAGALVGAMIGGMVGAVTQGDRTASSSSRRRMDTFLISGAALGGIYGWVKLARDH